MARSIIICEECGKEKPKYAKGMCEFCYQQTYQRTYREEHTEYFKEYRKDNSESLLEYGKNYRENNQEGCKEARRRWCENNQERRKEYCLKKRFNITLMDYNKILKAQDNVCAICGKTPEENGKRLAVDHNHETGEIRGLLCNHCNLVIGYASESPQILLEAIEYLLKWRNQNAETTTEK